MNALQIKSVLSATGLFLLGQPDTHGNQQGLGGPAQGKSPEHGSRRSLPVEWMMDEENESGPVAIRRSEAEEPVANARWNWMDFSNALMTETSPRDSLAGVCPP